MKLRLTVLLTTLLLAAPVYAATTDIKVSDAQWSEYDEYDEKYCTFDYKCTNLSLSKPVSLGRNTWADINWTGDYGKTYELTGKGAISAEGVHWSLSNATYIFSQTGNIANGENNIFGGYEVILNTAKPFDQIMDVKNLTIANKKAFAELVYADTISSPYELTTKNLGGIIGGCNIIKADLLVNGQGIDSAGIWVEGGYHAPTIKGHVTFKSKTETTFNLWTHDHKLSTQEQAEELEAYHNYTIFSCSSYSGDPNSLNPVLYYAVEDYEDYEDYEVSGKKMGSFVAIYNDANGQYDIVFRAFSKAANIRTLTSSQSGTYSIKGKDIYIDKSLTLASNGPVHLTWDGAGSALAMMGKGTLSGKKGMDVSIKNGTFSMSKGCGFKNADFTLQSASLSLGSSLSAASLQMAGNSHLALTAPKAQSIALKDKSADNTLSQSVVKVDGKLSVAGNLMLNNASHIILNDPSGKNKAMGLSVKGNLTLCSGSSLSLNGAISAASLTLDSGSIINLSGSKPLTIKAGNELNINGNIDLNLTFSVKAKEVNKKSFKILTFKQSNLGSIDSLYAKLGLSDSFCTLTYDKKMTSVSLMVTDWDGWNAYINENKERGSDGAPPDSVADTMSQSYSVNAPVADALVQADWGQQETSRAFVNAIANRSMAVQLGRGERAVWASAIGGSSRHSSAGGHAGADTNVSGGAFGMETQLGRASLFGMALGNSWTRVSAHSFDTIKQDTTHLGVYGRTNWSRLSADWSAAYGRSESDISGCDWSQKHLQLDGRVRHNHELNEHTTLSSFGGMQYYASDSASVNGIDIGSLQNLRAEIGVGASHRAGKLGLYGEMAVHQDIVRHNPHVWIEGSRFGGMNPGRTGLNYTVGASYEINDKWNVNASYSGEIVENANVHSANLGASYKF